MQCTQDSPHFRTWGVNSTYGPHRMYGLDDAVGRRPARHWLRGVPARAIKWDAVATLRLRFGPIATEENARCRIKALEPQGFNPSIVRAPAGLCPKCAYAVAVRAETMHQCFGRGQRLRGFRGTAVAVLDAELAVLDWAWYVNDPWAQFRTLVNANSTRGGVVAAGSGRASDPPRVNTVRDVRLLNFDGLRLFATWGCLGCRFNVALVEIRAVAASDGSLVRGTLRAWTQSRWRAFEEFMHGRNQATYLCILCYSTYLLAEK